MLGLRAQSRKLEQSFLLGNLFLWLCKHIVIVSFIVPLILLFLLAYGKAWLVETVVVHLCCIHTFGSHHTGCIGSI